MDKTVKEEKRATIADSSHNGHILARIYFAGTDMCVQRRVH